MTRPASNAADAADIDVLRKELRRLRGENPRLEEDKAELELRKKIPRGISTS